MDWKLELVFVPVSDVDRAKDFYVNKVGFNADFDERPSDSIRFVQLTPRGSACSICIGEGLSDAAPGTGSNLQLVVSDIHAAHKHLKDNGVDVSDVDVQEWGHFVYFADPDGNRWAVQYIPGRES
jgi:predicted enzyme related to lactoylglutathione lyase